MVIGWYILNCIELKRPASWLWKGQKVWKFGRSLGKLQRREDKLHKVHFRGGRLFSQWKPYSEELLCWEIYNPSTLKYTVAHISKCDTMQICRSMTWLCVLTLWDSSTDSTLTQRLPWLLWQLWLWLFIFSNAHCVKSHFQHSMAGLSCFLKFVCLTLTSVTLYIDNFRHHHLWNSFNCFTSIPLSFWKHWNQTAGQF